MEKNHSDIALSYNRAMKLGDWYQTRSLRWTDRIRRHPFLTLRCGIVDRFWKTIIALGLHDMFLEARTFWGDHMLVTFPDYSSIYHHGLIDGRELPVENFVVKFLKPGDVCIDVGANVGFYTLLFSALVGDTGKVHAFEPTPRTFAILSKNTSQNKNVTLVDVALMESVGERELADYGASKSGLNTILPVHAEGRAQPRMLPVKATTLDSYCSVNSLRPTFIKIDTEGAEEMVLSGGRQILTTQHPVIIVEVQRRAPQRVVSLLTSIGYSVYQFVQNKPEPYKDGDTILCPNLLFRYEQ